MVERNRTAAGDVVPKRDAYGLGHVGFGAMQLEIWLPSRQPAICVLLDCAPAPAGKNLALHNVSLRFARP